MPRIRSIKPDFFKSEDVSALPLRARLTWVGLWTQCDDHGRYKDSARLIKGDLWSLDDVSLRDIEEDLAVLEAERRIVRYEVDGKRYLAVVNWHAHQAINRPGRAKHPAPPEALASANNEAETFCSTGECTSANPHARLSEGSLNAHGTDVEPTAAIEPVNIDKPAGEGAISSQGHKFRDDSLTTHGGLTEDSRQEGKGREGKGGDAREGVSDDPPAPRCPRHIDDPKPPSCGACADARRARNRWDLADSERRRRAPKCPNHRGQPADNCALCRSEALAAETEAS